ncbi:hypothetical protein NUACC26_065160 [Scytonema sp. NUACC26]
MRTFTEAYPNEKFVQLVAAQIPSFLQNSLILDRIKDYLECEWYVQKKHRKWLD